MQSTAPPTPPQQDLNKMQPPQSQLFVPGTVNNSTGNARTNQQNSIYRGSAASTAPRGGGRHVPTVQTMFSQPIQPIVLPPYPTFAHRQPPFQQTSWQPIAAGYPSYPYPFYPTNSMIPATAQTHQRGPSGVASAIPVQTGPNGPLGGPNGTQPQLSLSAGTVLTATVPGSAAVIGVAQSQPTVQSMGTGYARKKARPHAIKIINPITNEDVLDELNKSGQNSDLEYQDDLLNPPIADLSMVASVGGVATVDLGDASKGMPYNMDMMQRTMTTCPLDMGQTPIVSAMSDCPSVEIRPTPQQPKRKNKSIPIVAPPDHKDNKSQTAKTAEDIQNKAIKPEVYNTSTETLTVISSITESLSRNQATSTSTAITSPVTEVTPETTASTTGVDLTKSRGLVTVKTDTAQPEEVTSTSNSNSLPATASSSPTSTLSTLSSASSPTSLSLLPQQTQLSSASASKDLTAENQDITTAVINDTTIASKNFSKNNAIASENQEIPLDSMKLSEGEINVVHANTQTLPDDLVMDPSATATSSTPPPVVLSPALPITNGNDDIATPTENQNLNNNIQKAKVFDKNLDKSTTISNNNKNLNTTSKKTAISASVTAIASSSPPSSSSLDEIDRSAAQQIATTNSSVSNTNDSAVPKTESTVQPSMDLFNNNNVLNNKSKPLVVATNESTDNTVKTSSPSQTQNNLITTPTTTLSSTTNETTIAPELDSDDVDVIANVTQIESDQPVTTLNGEMDVNSTTSVNAQEEPEIMAPGKNKPTPEQAAAMQAAIESLINYNEGQWSPHNPTGKKQYDRDQLLQLRDAKASRISPDVSTINPLILPQPNNVSQTNLMPSFAARIHPNFKRGNGMSIHPISDRPNMGMGGVGAGGTGYSKQTSLPSMNQRPAKSNKSNVFYINLSLNQDVKLNKTDNAWRPRIFVASEAHEQAHDSEDLKRRVRGILNKLTPEKFDTLVEQIIKLKIDTNEKVNDVMELVFEKAIDEPNFSVSYARLCQRLVDEVKARDEKSIEGGTPANLKQFRTSLLDKTENEFNENVTDRTAKEIKLQPILDKISECEDPVEKLELQAQLEEEERKIRRRSGGTVRFIGELFKISMLTGKIINSCIDNLVDAKSEDKLECLCKLLTTVGEKFEKTPINKDATTYYSLDPIVKRMQAIASKTDKDGSKISSRVRFMLQDVIDLRRNKWVSNRGETPKTMEEIQKQAKTEQMSTQYMNYGNIMSNNNSGNLSGSGGQSSGGGGTMKKDDRRYGGGGNNIYGNNRDGSRGGGGRGGDDGGSMRRQHHQGGNNNMGGDNGSSLNSGEDTWYQVQTGKGNRSVCAVDTSKLGSMLYDVEFDTKKMGGRDQFLWPTSGSQSRSTTTPSNSFAVLSTLSDLKSSNDRNDRNDRNDLGQRNKVGYNKGSMERDRYDRGVHSRGGSAHGSRESSSSRNNQGGRSMMNASNMQKRTSHNKNQYQSITPRMQTKSAMHTPSMSASSSRQSSPPHINSMSQSVAGGELESPTIAPVAIFDEPSTAEKKAIKSAISEMVEIVSTTKTLNQLGPCLTRFKENFRSYFLFMILAEYLHLANVGQVQRRHAANIVAYYLKHNYISLDHLKLAYEHFCELSSELILDVPDLWTYIFQFAALLIAKKLITIRDLWRKDLAEQNPTTGAKLLKTFLVCCTCEIGPEFTRNMWKTLDLKWTDFIPEADVADFIKTNKFEFVQNDKVKYKVTLTEDKEKLIQRVVECVDHMLREEAQGDSIIDFINGNVADIDLSFVRLMTKTVCNFAITYKENTFKLDTISFRNVCVPILRFIIDSKEPHEHECLNAILALTTLFENPKDLVNSFVTELQKADVITQSSFHKWRESKEETLPDKSVDLKGLNPFSKKIQGSEANEEN